ncbi:MAG: mannose-6-phosphate isomerase [Capnocytophaga sp.]|nr:mannose-6-phosphate isomerase [Capnocytophaga sp.]
MTSLYPFKFQPILKERLWGGTKLQSVLGKPLDSDIIGESWELSGVAGDVSVIANGALVGHSLQEVIEKYKGDLLGNAVYQRFGNDFPILIKFIDAKQDLSIQVHPNDELAKKRHNSFGKTEMWYVMDADPNAQLIVGFNKNVDKEEYQNHLENKTLTEILNYESVKEGSTFFINTGKVHAIGAGILLAEIQQTSDITYRVYDFDRKDKNGNLRELHTELALDAIDYQKKDDFKVDYSTTENQINKMVSCPYFITNYIKLTENYTIAHTEDSFYIYMCVKGEGEVFSKDSILKIQKGETILVPANCKHIELKTKGIELLQVHL